MSYTLPAGARVTEAYLAWLAGLRDAIGRARVQVRVDRLVHGTPGDHRSLGGGLWELRVHAGPGYRVYYVSDDRGLTILLGGDKGSQPRDIARARRLAAALPQEQ
jgi:putative addiction module killer protein